MPINSWAYNVARRHASCFESTKQPVSEIKSESSGTRYMWRIFILLCIPCACMQTTLSVRERGSNYRWHAYVSLSLSLSLSLSVSHRRRLSNAVSSRTIAWMKLRTMRRPCTDYAMYKTAIARFQCSKRRGEREREREKSEKDALQFRRTDLLLSLRDRRWKNTGTYSARSGIIDGRISGTSHRWKIHSHAYSISICTSDLWLWSIEARL